MTLDDEFREGLNVALNEAEVVGLRLEPSGAWCDLLLHVLALPEVGPLDPDRRRILRLRAPGRLTVLLRHDQTATAGYGAVIPLANLDAVEEFFATLTWSGAMYGWSFLDNPARTQDWPDEPSLTIEVKPVNGSHTLFWFNECGHQDAAYCIEGTVTFDDLEVLRADTTPEPLEQFIADGARHWQALNTHDERLSVDAQTAAQSGTPTWRPSTSYSVTVTGSERKPT